MWNQIRATRERAISRIQVSGSSTIRWTSMAASNWSARAATSAGPKVMNGTKWPSPMSTWSASAPASMSRRASSPRASGLSDVSEARSRVTCATPPGDLPIQFLLSSQAAIATAQLLRALAGPWLGDQCQRRSPCRGNVGDAFATQDGGGLNCGTGGRGLRQVTHVHRPTSQVGQQLSIRGRPGATTRHDQAAVRPRPRAGKRVQTVEQTTDDPLEDGPGQLLAGDVRTQASQRPSGEGAIRRALAVKVGDQDGSIGPGRSSQ